MIDKPFPGRNFKFRIPPEAVTELLARAKSYWLSLRKGDDRVETPQRLVEVFAGFAARVGESNPGSSIADIIDSIEPTWKQMVECSVTASAYRFNPVPGRHWNEEYFLLWGWKKRVTALLMVAGIPQAIETVTEFPPGTGRTTR